MRRLLTFCGVLFGCLLSLPLHAAELAIVPPKVTLTGPTAQQQLLAVEQDATAVALADRTATVTWTSSDPGIVRVDASGMLTPVRDGIAQITAQFEGRRTQIPVTVEQSTTPQRWSFTQHVQPILTRLGCNSGACHGALAGKGGLKLSLRGYDSESDHFVITRQAQSRRINGLEPAKSLLLLKGARRIPHGGGTRLEAESREDRILTEWIAQGAPAARPNEATVAKLDVFPKAMRGKPGDKFRVIVQARMSDGHTEDVTGWVRFGSSEDQVATVDEDGQVTVAGNGEAAITVVYGSFVATVPMVSPFPNAIAADVFRNAERRNAIDPLILTKLQELNLPPSPPCDDATFIRRVFLDVAGILPTPSEVQQFLADSRPDKRAKLIDALLERPEYVDYWTYKWCDLLLVSTRKLQPPAMWAYYRKVRSSVEANQPWDRFARDILTATGSNLEQGGGNFYLLHTDVAELTESMAVTFLGMSITCARCHNHPLERWTQDQYWSLANLFSRVTMKNGQQPGEVHLSAADSGDVLHPRLNRAMPPTPLDGKPLPLNAESDRRAYFVDWLTAKDNPYFAKAIVNRVWRAMMGRGLVEAEDDLRETNPPSNPALFQALSADFVASQFDVKQLIRTIANSAAYQRSSIPLPGNAADDRFYSRYLVRRLSAEVTLDAFAAVTNVPTPFTHVYNGVENQLAATGNYPLGLRALQLPDSRVASPFLETFGRPLREQTCSCEREADSSVGQALHLNNNQSLNQKLRAPNSRLNRWLADNRPPAEIVRELFAWTLHRAPTERERREFEAELTAATTPQARREALEDLTWAILTSKEFLFNH
ncbi:DUF1553 domain-containing protein [Tuwongella immobilis]|uniref:BIG2 domain-containing protein n=1 Tax=Tuwongella immobilis TaxID=692036 RepID=A0A6C2YV11_9BACT|nr:DUF1553 domain-containing protein [Tuwongella immobilis]VIP05003.1 Ig-like domain-containing protein OS=Singulisphaera acidiphila (strain ATCC BAA-1392 / DSM 18658 / VKM B-2454 / MOB10) GN=Sinac_1516 PE=4 SV=1: Big_2: Big_2: PSCyt2: PSD1 [Tuwongella immobilis]VTS07364.1 Ig-like domain-containing protein OS=Singulisphaera acidiphila (strain ATCC BAA-1392 / DSM 18658 / VKM B-2454 / MOB10) GN=Sinac_1516 PE=4 SV=1: Big_2: Big_2: PSCyt2: PSD1 [Tuwongella immobilis]